MYRQSLQLLAVLVGLCGAFAAPSQVADKLTGQEPSVVEHNAVTTQLWEGYDYCQGRTIKLGDTWTPLENSTLVKLQVLHRHGALAPGLGDVPGDETEWYQCGNPDEFMYMNEGNTASNARSPRVRENTVIEGPFAFALWKGNCDVGQLTSYGSHQLLQLGQTLRSIYVDSFAFLPAEISTDIKISHTYIWRTRESVENLLNGLYPSSSRPSDMTLIMNVKPSLIETMIPPTDACPKLANLTAQFATSATYKDTLMPYASLQDKLVQAYNTTGIKGFNTTQTLYDTASATFCHGLGLKGNLTAADIQTATIPGTSLYHNFLRQGPHIEEAKRLAVGGWIKEILESLSNHTQPLEVFSAHDASLDMFLSVVAYPDLPWPAFGSSVLLELWQQDGNPDSLAVRMFYEGMIVPSHPELNCDFNACPFGTLKEFLEGYIPGNFDEECNMA